MTLCQAENHEAFNISGPSRRSHRDRSPFVCVCAPHFRGEFFQFNSHLLQHKEINTALTKPLNAILNAIGCFELSDCPHPECYWLTLTSACLYSPRWSRESVYSNQCHLLFISALCVQQLCSGPSVFLLMLTDS